MSVVVPLDDDWDVALVPADFGAGEHDLLLELELLLLVLLVLVLVLLLLSCIVI